MIKPFLHWVGGKRQLLPEIKKYMPKQYNVYYEPFLGAGAVLFELQPKVAVVNDFNSELVNCYESIRDHLNHLLEEFNRGYFDNEKRYYEIRSWDRSDKWPTFFQSWERAARTIYLNKTCFNGLYRLNSKGQFNVPYGKHKKLFEVEKDTLIDVSAYLDNNAITILNTDFSQVIKEANKNDFVYFDPPYDPVSDTSNFTNYTADGFNKDDQRRLYYAFKELSNRGCYCMLSNAGTDFIKELYRDFYIVDVQARRSVNCNGDSRGKVSEVLI
ncbi:MAG: DNA adenine methylase, partial [Crenarchaeota archaeon]|nr:DNA adenine methylase [Thermoproteota archaeon]